MSPQENWSSNKKLIVYHTNWSTYGRNFQVKDLPINFISDVNYAFLDLKQNSMGFYVPTITDAWSDIEKRYTNESDCVPPVDTYQKEHPYFGNFRQFANLRALGYKFNLGLSIGVAVSTEPARAAFVNECITLLNKFPGLFNRIDLDWEHISPNNQQYGNEGNVTHPDDGVHFGLFLQLLRRKLDESGLGHVTITACATGDPSKISALPLSIMSSVLESINIMTYDFSSSSFGPCLSGHQSNLWSTPYSPLSIDNAVKGYLAAGVPSHKIVIGAVLYSRGFANTDGLGCPSSGTVSEQSWEAGVCDYKSLPRPGAVEYYDEKACASYSYNSTLRILNSYDTPESIDAKCRYVHQHNLKGVIVWESSGDYDINHPRSVIRALYDGLNK
ncbi:hypothetical protein HDV02_001736 [Globomyces sp. JEL0801]|nr:hypothetical protein HDV02_001736 [Globomyces sp. JEL0801]